MFERPNTYTESIPLPFGVTYNGFLSGVMITTSSSNTIATFVDCSVKFTRDSASDPIRTVTLRGGEISPIKIKQFYNASNNAVGFNQMFTTFTQSFNIPSGGWTGQASALMYPSTTLTTGITAEVRLWGNDPSSVPTTIVIRATEISPVHIRWINCGATLVGFN